MVFCGNNKGALLQAIGNFRPEPFKINMEVPDGHVSRLKINHSGIKLIIKETVIKVCIFG